MTRTLPLRDLAAIDRAPVRTGDSNVAAILEAVRRDGDAALARYAAGFGDPAPRRIERAELDAALERIPAAIRRALEGARERIERFARAQREALRDFTYESDGMRLSQRVLPLQSVGAYVPAGRFPLPSTALMTIVPAVVAGVERIAVCTPRATDATLAACTIAGATEVYELGGAQAIAALAFGTNLVARVDKIVGPGNAYVTEAKRLVAGVCGIDLLAGPSEVAVVAGDDADPALVAASLIAEAEHDVDARAFLITDAPAFVDTVEAELDRRLDGLETTAIARAALARSGAVVCTSMEACIAAANTLAVEHLELHGKRASAGAADFHSYGALFVELAAAFGDYGTGPNHTLPTGGAARYSSGLSVYDYLLVRPQLRPAGGPSDALVDDCAELALTEALPGHFAALRARR
jgi:phosphoribosyl-ATP pyrophosphohydrolase/phosphoribosyl-AMP cyclohydrolase/histidinol dehydrogenase